MENAPHRVCPVEHAGGLDNRFRRWLHHPATLLAPYVSAGMTVLDVGCGPGFFTLELARLVGPTGQVIAADVQEGMLQLIRAKVDGSELATRITLHRCGPKRLGVTTPVDFALAFYMLHEVPDQAALFTELAAVLTPQGRLLIVEPPFHVTKSAFSATLARAHDAGLTPVGTAKVALGYAVVLGKSG